MIKVNNYSKLFLTFVPRKTNKPLTPYKMNNLNNTTERRPQAVFTKWDYATGEQLAQRRVFMDPISFIESIQELWPDEHAIHFDKNKNAYVGAFGIPENENEIPFLYRFELALL